MHYGPAPLKTITPEWQIIDANGKALLTGSLPVSDIAVGSGQSLGTISASLAQLPSPAPYSLVLGLAGTSFSNHWNFWLYPATAKAAAPQHILVTSSWDEAKVRLAAGGEVLFLSGTPEKPSADLSLTTLPIFWNRLMNPNRTWMLGLLNDLNHAALAGFPTEDCCDWQWVNLLPNTVAMNMEVLSSSISSIVQPIDDWNRNLRLSMMFECRVGAGKLMVTSFNLSDQQIESKPAGIALRKSLLDYMASAKFKPKHGITMVELETWMPVRYVAPIILNSPPAINDVADPGQVNK